MNMELYQQPEYPHIEAFTPEQEALLSQPLDISLTKHHPGAGGRQLPYLSTSTVMAVANHIFGFGKWGYRLLSRTLEQAIDAHGEVIGLYYAVDIELFVVGAAFPFPGDGMAIVEPRKDGTYTIEAHETARKGAVRDALKRALIYFGDSFGLCLQDEDAYVQASDGSAVQVKAIPVNAGKSKPRQVVDARKSGKVSALPTGQKPAKGSAVISLDERIKYLKNRALKADLAHDKEE